MSAALAILAILSLQDDKPVAKPLPTGLVLSLPATWKEGQPSSKMRLAQFAVADKEKKAADAELVVFHFGAGGAGTVEANIERWIAQFKGAKREDAKIEKVKGTLESTLVDLSGHYAPPARPGGAAEPEIPGARMLAAVIATPQGNHFLKLVGPKETIDDWAKEFREAVSGATFKAKE